jgi:anti-anti-sigma regulatory factor
MFWLDQNTGGQATVRFRGNLDASTAREVKPFLSGDPSSRVTLDFSQAGNVDYYGLSALVAEVIASGRTVHIRGLRVDHLRILRYFGLDPLRFGIEDGANVDDG